MRLKNKPAQNIVPYFRNFTNKSSMEKVISHVGISVSGKTFYHYEDIESMGLGLA